jgi:ATP-dependent RNA helicase DDX49/DBP8
MQFKELKLKPWLLRLADRIAYRTPTPIQEQAIPPLLEGKSVLMLAQTGSGKTAAFGLPMLHQLSEQPFGVFGVIVVPSRELALQIQEKMQVYGEGLNLRMALLIGGTNYLRNID